MADKGLHGFVLRCGIYVGLNTAVTVRLNWWYGS